ncbi:major facilitator superfamily domain-containing protein [Aspergillus venezuelensis]
MEPSIETSDDQTYSSFLPQRKTFIVLIVGIATITSPLTATVYFPLLPTLQEQYHASSQAVNMTLTIYIFFQALSPALFGPLSDAAGRRPIYLLTLAIYALANLDMALNTHIYGVLLMLRFFQSLGASASSAISYGIVADIWTCLGPVMGGLVAYLSGATAWIFWALAIVGFLLFALVGLFLPETARNLVGNGSDKSKFSVWQRSWADILSEFGKREFEKQRNEMQSDSEGTSATKISWRNVDLRIFLTSFRIIFYPDAFLSHWMHGSLYAVDYTLAAAVSDIFTNTYDINVLNTGLAFLPRGVGIMMGGYCNGRIMDYNYKVTARKHNQAIDGVSGDNLRDFPIERARSRGTYYLLIISTGTLLAYGWTVQHEKPFSIPLVLQFMQCFWGTCFYTIYNTLLVDVFPQSPSTAAATTSITRFAMAATAVSILRPLLEAMGLGWYFTALGIWGAVCGAAAVWCLRRRVTFFD